MIDCILTKTQSNVKLNDRDVPNRSIWITVKTKIPITVKIYYLRRSHRSWKKEKFSDPIIETKKDFFDIINLLYKQK